MTELCDLSAVELRRLIGARQVSPREVWASCRARMEQVNGAVNAVVAIDEEGAAAQALAAEQAVLRGEALGALHGLPLGIKDLNETRGLRTTHGSLIYRDHVPAEDESLVARLRAAGGLIACKTNTPEFGAGANTVNKVYGATGNPFDPRLTCAGSSGGSAVALALDMVPLATGSDLGGSLRTPAAYCGVVGFRPTPGRVPCRESSRGYAPLSVEGPMARSVADVALMLAVLAEHDPLDPLSRPGETASLAQPWPVDPASLRVVFSEDLGVAPVEQGIRRVFRDRMARIQHVYKSAERRDPPRADASPVFETLRAHGFVAAHRAHYEQHRELLGPNVVVNTERGLKLSAREVGEAEQAHSALLRRFMTWLDEVDLLVCPAAAVTPFDKTQLYPTHVDGRPLDTYIHWVCLAYAITLTGSPSLVIPCGLDEQGLPFGIQLVGKRWDEARLLGIGLALEAELARIPECRRPRPDLAGLAGRSADGARDKPSLGARQV